MAKVLPDLVMSMKRTADVQGQQRDDDAVQHLIDDAGEVFHAVVKGITDGLAAQGGHAQAQHKGQHHGREGVQNGRDGDGDVAGQRVVSRGGDLLQSALRS